MNTEADFVALIQLAPTGASGRKTPIGNGYRPMLNMSRPDMRNDATLQLIDANQLGPGESGLARFWMLVPDFQLGRLFPGFQFEILEGGRKIGSGTITEVINRQLLAGEG